MIKQFEFQYSEHIGQKQKDILEKAIKITFKECEKNDWYFFPNIRINIDERLHEFLQWIQFIYKKQKYMIKIRPLFDDDLIKQYNCKYWFEFKKLYDD